MPRLIAGLSALLEFAARTAVDARFHKADRRSVANQCYS